MELIHHRFIFLLLLLNGRINLETNFLVQQLPLALAWAITIHKSQGLTLEDVVIELRPKDFLSGLSFVAISKSKI
ncbi:hypothetical protein L208DRAFT_1289017 [Tricholoma matsutake]|nr:hypothetical protein L208DRAFT_1289017 [Tricholoma matsutake 945]